MQRNRQAGMTSVEFAIVGGVLMMVIIGILELNRVFFVYSTLDEVTRRGARVAAVCPVNDPAIQSVAVFNRSGGTDSPIVNGLQTGNVAVNYLDIDGNTLANPATTDFVDIEFVRVAIQNFQVQTFIPFLTLVLDMPPMAATIPRESLGIPRAGAIVPC